MSTSSLANVVALLTGCSLANVGCSFINWVQLLNGCITKWVQFGKCCSFTKWVH